MTRAEFEEMAEADGFGDLSPFYASLPHEPTTEVDWWNQLYAWLAIGWRREEQRRASARLTQGF